MMLRAPRCLIRYERGCRMYFMQKSPKKLYRHATDAVFSGVIIGFAKYFVVDVTLLRVLFVFFVLATGFFPGVAAYIIAIFMIPVKEDDITIIQL